MGPHLDDKEAFGGVLEVCPVPRLARRQGTRALRDAVLQSLVGLLQRPMRGLDLTCAAHPQVDEARERQETAGDESAIRPNEPTGCLVQWRLPDDHRGIAEQDADGRGHREVARGARPGARREARGVEDREIDVGWGEVVQGGGQDDATIDEAHGAPRRYAAGFPVAIAERPGNRTGVSRCHGTAPRTMRRRALEGEDELLRPRVRVMAAAAVIETGNAVEPWSHKAEGSIICFNYLLSSVIDLRLSERGQQAVLFGSAHR